MSRGKGKTAHELIVERIEGLQTVLCLRNVAQDPAVEVANMSDRRTCAVLLEMLYELDLPPDKRVLARIIARLRNCVKPEHFLGRGSREKLVLAVAKLEAALAEEKA